MALSNKLRGNATTFFNGSKVHKHIYACIDCGLTYRGISGQRHRYACRICGKRMRR